MKNSLNTSSNKVRLTHCILYDQFRIKKLVIGTNFNMFIYFLFYFNYKFFQISSSPINSMPHIREIILKKFWRKDFFQKEFLLSHTLASSNVNYENWTRTNYNFNESGCGGSRLARSFTRLTRRSGRLLPAVRNEREPNRSLKAKYHRLPAISFQVLLGIWLETGGIRSRAFSKLAKLPTRIGFSSFAPLRNLHDFRFVNTPIERILFPFFSFFFIFTSSSPVHSLIYSFFLVSGVVRTDNKMEFEISWFARNWMEVSLNQNLYIERVSRLASSTVEQAATNTPVNKTNMIWKEK